MHLRHQGCSRTEQVKSHDEQFDISLRPLGSIVPSGNFSLVIVVVAQGAGAGAVVAGAGEGADAGAGTGAGASERVCHSDGAEHRAQGDAMVGREGERGNEKN
jgi:hypothetical protein